MRSERVATTYIDALAAVVGKGWAKGKRAIPVRGPSVAVCGTGEDKDRVGQGVNRVGTRQRVWDRDARDARHLG
jgi:hypothetical protein